MADTAFQRGDCVQVISAKSATRVSIDERYVGYRGWITEKGGRRRMSGGEIRQWFQVELEEKWPGRNRLVELPADVIELCAET